MDQSGEERAGETFRLRESGGACVRGRREELWFAYNLHLREREETGFVAYDSKQTNEGFRQLNEQRLRDRESEAGTEGFVRFLPQKDERGNGSCQSLQFPGRMGRSNFDFDGDEQRVNIMF